MVLILLITETPLHLFIPSHTCLHFD
jgi:hypothetical protein